MLLKLSDDELSAIMTACQPLEPSQRDGFLQLITSLLRDCCELGLGTVHRAIVVPQRHYSNPPTRTRGPTLK